MYTCMPAYIISSWYIELFVYLFKYLPQYCAFHYSTRYNRPAAVCSRNSKFSIDYISLLSLLVTSYMFDKIWIGNILHAAIWYQYFIHIHVSSILQDNSSTRSNISFINHVEPLGPGLIFFTFLKLQEEKTVKKLSSALRQTCRKSHHGIQVASSSKAFLTR